MMRIPPHRRRVLLPSRESLTMNRILRTPPSSLGAARISKTFHNGVSLQVPRRIRRRLPTPYAAAYTDVTGDQIFYFGADRISNNGDTFLGFWFFKSLVSIVDGDFDGNHVEGDTLVLVNFPQATNAVPEIAVVEWDTSCNKADSNDPMPGECAAANLRLLLEGSGAGGAVCAAGDGVNPIACAIANDENGPNDPTPAPWPYTFKDGTEGSFPFETFFEGGINITELVGGPACFSSFMAESRSSSSFTAALKDFVLAEFAVCSIEVTKTPDVDAVCNVGGAQDVV